MGIAPFSGIVKDFQATFADGSLTGTAQIASLVTKDENLQTQLLSPEFFRHQISTSPALKPTEPDRGDLSWTTHLALISSAVNLDRQLADNTR